MSSRSVDMDPKKDLCRKGGSDCSLGLDGAPITGDGDARDFSRGSSHTVGSKGGPTWENDHSRAPSGEKIPGTVTFDKDF